jgi:hypothetical protein
MRIDRAQARTLAGRHQGVAKAFILGRPRAGEGGQRLQSLPLFLQFIAALQRRFQIIDIQLPSTRHVQPMAAQ